MMKKINFSKVTGFEWDSGNKEKNKVKHNVEISESEEVFLNDPIYEYDIHHSQSEDRFLAYGITDKNRPLIISFTLRGDQKNKIRIISSRDQHKKEREHYKILIEEKNK